MRRAADDPAAGAEAPPPGAVPPGRTERPHRPGPDWPFHAAFIGLGSVYVLLVVALLAADVLSTSPRHLLEALAKPEIRFAVRLTLVTCTIAALLSIVVAMPLAYLLSRHEFPGRRAVEAVLDIPVVLPPLVLGLSLLILFHLPVAGTTLESLAQRHLRMRVAYTPVAVVIAQFAVACAFAVHSLQLTFDRIDPRAEQVARTLGCRRDQAFCRVVLPQAWRGVVAAFTIAWARSLGEFGPILVFAGATRMRTEVLSTTVFLELSVGQLEAAVAVSLIMIAAAIVVLAIVRLLGGKVA
ncbi:MAG: ABC transporter permease subunit [Planctomycetia bacterium]|nr:ABC transporter permease subunit [Planctomycetia bacterium]